MDNSRNRNNRARQRQEDRSRRREMVSLPDQEAPVAARRPSLPSLGERWLQVKDFFWYLRNHTPVLQVGAGLVAILVMLFALATVFSPVVGYNVWALNTSISGMNLDEAATALNKTWDERLKINLVLNGETLREVSPSELGLTLDAGAMAQQAMDIRWLGFPMGYDIPPLVKADFGVGQSYLLGLVDTVYIPSYDAGFAYQNDQLVAMAGTPSRELDMMLVLENLMSNPNNIIKTKRLDLLTSSTPPKSVDGSPYLSDASTFINQNFRLIGYNPFDDTSTPWTSTKEEIAKWLAVGPNGLIVREAAFKQFLDALNGQYRASGDGRYLDTKEAIAQMQTALDTLSDRAYLRVRYSPGTLDLESGDWGQRIARRLGLPFGLISEVNQNLNWDLLEIGQTINLPTRDLVIPETPVPNKRIIVDLERRYLVAYENGEVKFSWMVSIGRFDAPTIPGVFQILSHTEKAYGSGFSLCGDSGCSQWVMDWFMGIYEISPGLMNGFHGAVLLPNGAYLDDGNIGNESTFGCVMGNNEQAKQLFDWAELGTIVEVISSEFPPQSELGREAMNYISQTYGV